MKILLLVFRITFLCLALSGLSSCFVQTMNSVDSDKKSFAPVAATSSQAFNNVRAILRTNCGSCHGSDIASYSEAEFISHGLVVAKQPTESKLFQKLKGAGAGGSEDMPENRPALSPSDLQTIKSWITNIGDVATAQLPTTPFGQAQLIITNSCVGCHKDLAGIAESDFVTKGWVNPGNAEQSKLFYKLIGTAVAGENTPDMPLKGDPLSANDIQTVRTWIDQMTPASFPKAVIFPDTRFGHVQKILSDSCVLCHKDFSGYSESDFATKQFITPGNSSTSKIYFSLIGSGPVSAKATMPEKGPALTAEQLKDVADWIDAMPVPPSATDLAIGQIKADFTQKVLPLVTRGCMLCHNAKATPDGLVGKLPGVRQLEWKHITEASAALDFSLPFPNWSKQSSNPVYYLNEIKTAITGGTMPPSYYKPFHEHDGFVLTDSENQVVLSWVNQSLSLLQAADTSKPTASKFFSNNCLGCHNSDLSRGGFQFQVTGDQVSVPTGKTQSGIPFITQLDPSNSAVYLVLLSDQTQRKGLAEMPAGGPSVSDSDAQFISGLD